MKFTKKRLLVMLACSLLPLAVVAFFGIAVMRGNVIPLPGFWIFSAVVPGITVLFIGLASFSNIHPIGKGFLLTGILVIMAVVWLFISFFTLNYAKCNRYTGQQIQEPYEQVLNDLMPALDELGDTKQMEFYQYRETASIFYFQADVLICTYSGQEYNEQVAALEHNYAFQSEPMEACDRTCDPTGTIGDYYFRFLAVDGTYEEQIYYPKQVVLIGTNDNTSEIVYIAFDNMDLDYLTTVEEFVNDYCGWEYIR